MTERLNLRGIDVFPGLIDPDTQAELVEQVRDVVRQAPLFAPETARGRKMSVRMTSAGAFGWVSDRRGYRYEPRHPSGVDWPAIPPVAKALWDRLVPNARPPECCLINHYAPEARMGLHQDRDEGDFTQPVLSISLGDDALFRVGGTERGGRTESLWLRSGDVLVMGGDARLLFHGVDRIRAGSSDLLAKPGRINLTLRVVSKG